MTYKETFLDTLENHIVEKQILIGDFQLCIDRAIGTIYIHNPKTDTIMYATPFWETDEDVICVENHTGEPIVNIPFILTGDIATDIESYFDLITNHLI